MDREAGFTVIELIVVIVVIGILTTIAVIEPINLMVTARDNERADDIASIARKLEQDYREGTAGSPEYPPTDTFATDTQGSNGVPTGTAAGIDMASYSAPGTSGSSVLPATNGNSTNNPRGAGTPALNEYVYQALQANGNLCTQATQPCVSFRLFYRREADDPTAPPVVIASLHQQ